MKKSILLVFILISSLTYGQTRELQQSIDSFRTVLNQQNILIRQLQTQVRRLNTTVNTLNDVPEFSKVVKQKQNAVDSTLISTNTATKNIKVQTKLVGNQPTKIDNMHSTVGMKKLIRESRFIKISGSRKYYRDRSHRLFYVIDNSYKVVYVN